MSNLKKKCNDRPVVAYRPLAIAVLIAGSTFQIIAPALAAGGLDITNKATATYNDGTPASIATPYNATSNTVTIRVNEVTGLTITPSAPSTTAPQPNSTLYVDFTITNTGYDTTQVFVPGTATLSDTTNYQLNGKLQIVSINSVAQTTPVDVPVAGAATGSLTFAGGTTGSLPPNSTVVVRVPVKVLGSASPATTLTVSLGDTPTASTTGNPQNNVVEAATPGTKDVYTVDNADGTAGEYPGTPVDQKEVMATSATITPAARFQAFAAVLKAGGYSNNSTPNLLTDDLLTYNLALKVDNPSSPPAGLAPSDLYGTAISVDGSSVNAVLVSDAIPANTQLKSVVTPPTNWQTVYVYGTAASSNTPLTAAWSTTPPTVTTLPTVTRVGFIYKTDASPVGNGPIAKSAAGTATTVSGFSFVVTPQASFTGGQIANMAQVFGQSQPGAPVGSTATQIVYDESGDQSYNNNLGGAGNPVTLNDAAGGINNGVADVTKDEIDPGTGTDPTVNTTNQGADPVSGGDLGGEAKVFTVAAAPLTGPANNAEIYGPGGSTGDPNKVKDYTNQSIVLPSGLNPATALDDSQTPTLTFTNTVKNNSTAVQTISFVPSLPATFGSNEAALPVGTTVIITPSGGSAVTFTYTATGFTLPSATNAPNVSVPANSTKDYTVAIDLPSGAQLTGYPVIITAFVDGDANNVAGANEPGNQTIDSYYTGYLKMFKEAQIQDVGGATPGTIYQAFTTDSALLGAAAQPNRVVEYRITYTNISAGNPSTDPAGNKALSANALTVLEDGATLPNTWFASTVDTTAPTVGTTGSLRVPTGSVVTLTTAVNGTVATDVKVYSVNVGNIAPAGTGQVIFDRKIKP
jgi:hypothetical protein